MFKYLIAVGNAKLMDFFCPVYPWAPFPQDNSLPVSVKKNEWFPPAATLMTFTGSLNSTSLGLVELLKSPVPNWPKVPLPQEKTLPF